MSTGKWWDQSWQVCSGCTPVSEACDNCYAARLASTRLKHHPRYKGLTKDGKWTGEVRLNPEELEKPLHWRKPRRIFVADMSDLFHRDVDIHVRNRVYDVVEACPQHTFMFLTKRPECIASFWMGKVDNVWLGVTAENQQRADERIPILLEIPAAVHFVSIEPMLGPVVLPEDFLALGQRAWVICGGESGPGARVMYSSWVRALRGQCVDAGVPFWFKQWGAWSGFDTPRPGHTGRYRVWRSGSGRALDGREWNQLPGDAE